MIGKRSTGAYIIAQTMKNANGIGQSKSLNKANSELKGQNGHNVSSKAHSIKTTQNLRSITTQYIQHLQEKHNTNKPFNHISNESIKEFLREKAESVSGGTLNTYISAAAKMADNLKEIGAKNIDRKEILSSRQELKNEGKDLHKGHYDRSYTPQQVEQIKEHMKDTPYSLSVELQHQAGLRIDDAINSEKWRLNEDNTLTIMGSKNGLNYTTRELSSELAQKCKEAIEEGYKISKSDYSSNLAQSGAENGSHGLRYTFAQERYEELKEQGKTILEAKAQISLEMGHSRAEITEHYLIK